MDDSTDVVCVGFHAVKLMKSRRCFNCSSPSHEPLEIPVERLAASCRLHLLFQCVDPLWTGFSLTIGQLDGDLKNGLIIQIWIIINQVPDGSTPASQFPVWVNVVWSHRTTAFRSCLAVVTIQFCMITQFWEGRIDLCQLPLSGVGTLYFSHPFANWMTLISEDCLLEHRGYWSPMFPERRGLVMSSNRRRASRDFLRQCHDFPAMHISLQWPGHCGRTTRDGQAAGGSPEYHNWFHHGNIQATSKIQWISINSICSSDKVPDLFPCPFQILLSRLNKQGQDRLRSKFQYVMKWGGCLHNLAPHSVANIETNPDSIPNKHSSTCSDDSWFQYVDKE